MALQYRYNILLHDLYPDGLVALGHLRDSTWWVKVWSHLNGRALRRAQRVITLGRDMSQRCQLKYHVHQEKCQVIPNWSPVHFDDDQRKRPEETDLWTSLPDHAKQAGVILIQYSGNMGLWHNIDDLVEAASALKDLPFHFVMIGEGRRRAPAQARATELQLENMSWLPFQPLSRLTDSLQCAHLSLVSQRNEVVGIMVPCKLYGILASGRAVVAIAPQDSEVAFTLQEHDCGVLIDPKKPQLLVETLKKLYFEDLDSIEQMGQSAKQAYLDHYDFEMAAQAFRELYTH